MFEAAPPLPLPLPPPTDDDRHGGDGLVEVSVSTVLRTTQIKTLVFEEEKEEEGFPAAEGKTSFDGGNVALLHHGDKTNSLIVIDDGADENPKMREHRFANLRQRSHLGRASNNHGSTACVSSACRCSTCCLAPPSSATLEFASPTDYDVPRLETARRARDNYIAKTNQKLEENDDESVERPRTLTRRRSATASGILHATKNLLTSLQSNETTNPMNTTLAQSQQRQKYPPRVHGDEDGPSHLRSRASSFSISTRAAAAASGTHSGKEATTKFGNSDAAPSLRFAHSAPVSRRTSPTRHRNELLRDNRYTLAAADNTTLDYRNRRLNPSIAVQSSETTKSIRNEYIVADNENDHHDAQKGGTTKRLHPPPPPPRTADLAAPPITISSIIASPTDDDNQPRLLALFANKRNSPSNRGQASSRSSSLASKNKKSNNNSVASTNMFQKHSRNENPLHSMRGTVAKGTQQSGTHNHGGQEVLFITPSNQTRHYMMSKDNNNNSNNNGAKTSAVGGGGSAVGVDRRASSAKSTAKRNVSVIRKSDKARTTKISQPTSTASTPRGAATSRAAGLLGTHGTTGRSSSASSLPTPTHSSTLHQQPVINPRTSRPKAQNNEDQATLFLYHHRHFDAYSSSQRSSSSVNTAATNNGVAPPPPPSRRRELTHEQTDQNENPLCSPPMPNEFRKVGTEAGEKHHSDRNKEMRRNPRSIHVNGHSAPREHAEKEDKETNQLRSSHSLSRSSSSSSSPNISIIKFPASVKEGTDNNNDNNDPERKTRTKKEEKGEREEKESRTRDVPATETQHAKEIESILSASRPSQHAASTLGGSSAAASLNLTSEASASSATHPDSPPASPFYAPLFNFTSKRDVERRPRGLSLGGRSASAPAASARVTLIGKTKVDGNKKESTAGSDRQRNEERHGEAKEVSTASILNERKERKKNKEATKRRPQTCERSNEGSQEKERTGSEGSGRQHIILSHENRGGILSNNTKYQHDTATDEKKSNNEKENLSLQQQQQDATKNSNSSDRQGGALGGRSQQKRNKTPPGRVNPLAPVIRIGSEKLYRYEYGRSHVPQLTTPTTPTPPPPPHLAQEPDHSTQQQQRTREEEKKAKPVQKDEWEDHQSPKKSLLADDAGDGESSRRLANKPVRTNDHKSQGGPSDSNERAPPVLPNDNDSKATSKEEKNRPFVRRPRHLWAWQEAISDRQKVSSGDHNDNDADQTSDTRHVGHDSTTVGPETAASELSTAPPPPSQVVEQPINKATMIMDDTSKNDNNGHQISSDEPSHISPPHLSPPSSAPAPTFLVLSAEPIASEQKESDEERQQLANILEKTTTDDDDDNNKISGSAAKIENVTSSSLTASSKAPVSEDRATEREEHRDDVENRANSEQSPRLKSLPPPAVSQSQSESTTETTTITTSLMTTSTTIQQQQFFSPKYFSPPPSSLKGSHTVISSSSVFSDHHHHSKNNSNNNCDNPLVGGCHRYSSFASSFNSSTSSSSRPKEGTVGVDPNNSSVSSAATLSTKVIITRSSASTAEDNRQNNRKTDETEDKKESDESEEKEVAKDDANRAVGASEHVKKNTTDDGRRKQTSAQSDQTGSSSISNHDKNNNENKNNNEKEDICVSTASGNPFFPENTTTGKKTTAERKKSEGINAPADGALYRAPLSRNGASSLSAVVKNTTQPANRAAAAAPTPTRVAIQRSSVELTKAPERAEKQKPSTTPSSRSGSSSLPSMTKTTTTTTTALTSTAAKSTTTSLENPQNQSRRRTDSAPNATSLPSSARSATLSATNNKKPTGGIPMVPPPRQVGIVSKNNSRNNSASITTNTGNLMPTSARAVSKGLQSGSHTPSTTTTTSVVSASSSPSSSPSTTTPSTSKNKNNNDNNNTATTSQSRRSASNSNHNGTTTPSNNNDKRTLSSDLTVKKAGATVTPRVGIIGLSSSYHSLSRSSNQCKEPLLRERSKQQQQQQGANNIKGKVSDNNDGSRATARGQPETRQPSSAARIPTPPPTFSKNSIVTQPSKHSGDKTSKATTSSPSAVEKQQQNRSSSRLETRTRNILSHNNNNEGKVQVGYQRTKKQEENMFASPLMTRAGSVEIHREVCGGGGGSGGVGGYHTPRSLTAGGGFTPRSLSNNGGGGGVGMGVRITSNHTNDTNGPASATDPNTRKGRCTAENGTAITKDSEIDAATDHPQPQLPSAATAAAAPTILAAPLPHPNQHRKLALMSELAALRLMDSSSTSCSVICPPPAVITTATSSVSSSSASALGTSSTSVSAVVLSTSLLRHDETEEGERKEEKRKQRVMQRQRRQRRKEDREDVNTVAAGVECENNPLEDCTIVVSKDRPTSTTTNATNTNIDDTNNDNNSNNNEVPIIISSDATLPTAPTAEASSTTTLVEISNTTIACGGGGETVTSDTTTTTTTAVTTTTTNATIVGDREGIERTVLPSTQHVSSTAASVIVTTPPHAAPGGGGEGELLKASISSTSTTNTNTSTPCNASSASVTVAYCYGPEESDSTCGVLTATTQTATAMAEQANKHEGGGHRSSSSSMLSSGGGGPKPIVVVTTIERDCVGKSNNGRIGGKRSQTLPSEEGGGGQQIGRNGYEAACEETEKAPITINNNINNDNDTDEITAYLSFTYFASMDAVVTKAEEAKSKSEEVRASSQASLQGTTAQGEQTAVDIHQAQPFLSGESSVSAQFRGDHHPPHLGGEVTPQSSPTLLMTSASAVSTTTAMASPRRSPVVVIIDETEPNTSHSAATARRRPKSKRKGKTHPSSSSCFASCSPFSTVVSPPSPSLTLLKSPRRANCENNNNETFFGHQSSSICGDAKNNNNKPPSILLPASDRSYEQQQLATTMAHQQPPRGRRSFPLALPLGKSPLSPQPSPSSPQPHLSSKSNNANGEIRERWQQRSSSAPLLINTTTATAKEAASSSSPPLPSALSEPSAAHPFVIAASAALRRSASSPGSASSPSPFASLFGRSSLSQLRRTPTYQNYAYIPPTPRQEKKPTSSPSTPSGSSAAAAPPSPVVVVAAATSSPMMTREENNRHEVTAQQQRQQQKTEKEEEQQGKDTAAGVVVSALSSVNVSAATSAGSPPPASALVSPRYNTNNIYHINSSVAQSSSSLSATAYGLMMTQQSVSVSTASASSTSCVLSALSSTHQHDHHVASTGGLFARATSLSTEKAKTTPLDLGEVQGEQMPATPTMRFRRTAASGGGAVMNQVPPTAVSVETTKTTTSNTTTSCTTLRREKQTRIHDDDTPKGNGRSHAGHSKSPSPASSAISPTTQQQKGEVSPSSTRDRASRSQVSPSSYFSPPPSPPPSQDDAEIIYCNSPVDNLIQKIAAAKAIVASTWGNDPQRFAGNRTTRGGGSGKEKRGGQGQRIEEQQQQQQHNSQETNIDLESEQEGKEEGKKGNSRRTGSQQHFADSSAEVPTASLTQTAQYPLPPALARSSVDQHICSSNNNNNSEEEEREAVAIGNRSIHEQGKEEEEVEEQEETTHAEPGEHGDMRRGERGQQERCWPKDIELSEVCEDGVDTSNENCDKSEIRVDPPADSEENNKDKKGIVAGATTSLSFPSSYQFALASNTMINNNNTISSTPPASAIENNNGAVIVKKGKSHMNNEKKDSPCHPLPFLRSPPSSAAVTPSIVFVPSVTSASEPSIQIHRLPSSINGEPLSLLPSPPSTSTAEATATTVSLSYEFLSVPENALSNRQVLAAGGGEHFDDGSSNNNKSSSVERGRSIRATTPTINNSSSPTPMSLIFQEEPKQKEQGGGGGEERDEHKTNPPRQPETESSASSVSSSSSSSSPPYPPLPQGYSSPLLTHTNTAKTDIAADQPTSAAAAAAAATLKNDECTNGVATSKNKRRTLTTTQTFLVTEVTTTSQTVRRKKKSNKAVNNTDKNDDAGDLCEQVDNKRINVNVNFNMSTDGNEPLITKKLIRNQTLRNKVLRDCHIEDSRLSDCQVIGGHVRSTTLEHCLLDHIDAVVSCAVTQKSRLVSSVVFHSVLESETCARHCRFFDSTLEDCGVFWSTLTRTKLARCVFTALEVPKEGDVTYVDCVLLDPNTTAEKWHPARTSRQAGANVSSASVSKRFSSLRQRIINKLLPLSRRSTRLGDETVTTISSKVMNLEGEGTNVKDANNNNNSLMTTATVGGSTVHRCEGIGTESQIMDIFFSENEEINDFVSSCHSSSFNNSKSDRAICTCIDCDNDGVDEKKNDKLGSTTVPSSKKEQVAANMTTKTAEQAPTSSFDLDNAVSTRSTPSRRSRANSDNNNNNRRTSLESQTAAEVNRLVMERKYSFVSYGGDEV